MLTQALIERCRALLDQYLSRIRDSTTALTDEQVWWRPNARSNSIANLILHLCGNLSQWGLAGLGDDVYARKRRQEFGAQTGATRAELLARLESIVAGVSRAVARLDDAELQRRRVIQGYDVTGLRALLGIVEHMSYHTGQVVLMAKMLSPAEFVIDFYPQHRDE
jgi:uncharacterized damage-inducible protein DinB